MKKIILASVVSTILVGCDGSDGGSSTPTTPPPPVHNDTYQSIADELNVDYNFVNNICSDASWECLYSDTESDVYVSIYDRFNLVTIESRNGEFFNGGVSWIEFKDVPLEVVDNKNDYYETNAQFTITTSNTTHMYDLATRNTDYYQQKDPDMVTFFIRISDEVSVYKNDLVSLLTSLSETEGFVSLRVRSGIWYNTSEMHFLEIEQDLSSKAYKAAFSILKQKNEELYQGN